MTAANAPQHAGAVDGSRRGRILRRALLTVCVLALVLGVTVYCHAREATETSDCSQWEIIFDGYGEASCSEGLLRLKPTSADSQDKTHAGLATSTTVEIEAGGVQTIHTTMTTVRQLREDGEPNAWEVAWLLWNYTDNNHFYALALKPNGWEVSKQDPAYPGGQRFLASGKTPTFPLGSKHTVTVTPIDDEAGFLVSANGKDLAKVVDKERPYKKGRVALYTEDAAVTFSDIRTGRASR